MKTNSLNLVSILVASLLLFTSCAKVFYSPDAEAIANKQVNIAIIPPVVSIAAQKNISHEAIIEQQKAESLNFQKEIYAWLLKRKMQGKISKEIQVIETTNAKLNKVGYPETPHTISELCEILNVDGVLTSSIGLSKPMSEGAAIATTILLGFGNTNEVTATLSINDCQKNKLIWNYEHKLAGGLGSSPSTIVDRLMRNASKKMPYVN